MNVERMNAIANMMNQTCVTQGSDGLAFPSGKRGDDNDFMSGRPWVSRPGGILEDRPSRCRRG